MMLTPMAKSAVGQVMQIGCFLHFFPFQWDRLRHRLSPTIGPFHQLIFHCHGYTQCIMCLFSLARFWEGLKETEMPPRIRVMNLLWILAYIHGIQGFFELKYRKKEILFFSNTLFEYIDENLYGEKRARKLEKVGPDWVSECVVLSYVLLIVSPALHGIMLLGNPCASHFASSIYLPCNSAGDQIGTWAEKIPFFVLENYLVAVFFFLLAFNWFIVFIGLGYLRAELREIRIDMEGNEDKLDLGNTLPRRYRELECAVTFLNEGFRLYLGWAPTIFMAHVGLLLFATFRFFDQDYISYFMFPVCGVRCMVDAVTPLAIAGYVSEESMRVIELWKQSSYNDGKDPDARLRRDWNRKFLLSIRIISCKAGSLYVMKNSILPVNLNHLAQLTLNLLIAYPHRPDQSLSLEEILM